MFDIKKLKNNPDINIYSKKPEIDNILKGFFSMKMGLLVYPVPFNNVYSSNIVKITDDYITIDSLMPQNGNLDVIESSYLKVGFKFKNNDHFFLSKLHNIKKNKDYIAFDIYKPIEILSVEKRKYFRTEPSLNEPVKLGFLLHDKYFNTNVYDIAGEGISFLFDFTIKKHTVLSEAKIKFPNNLPVITAKIEIRSILKLDNLKYKIGGQIINLKPKEQDIMFRYIFKRQREIVATMKGL